jgi:uncharacterized protein (DUF1501 family)
MDLTRRRFLVDGIRITALAPMLARHAGAAPPVRAGERILVVVQLTGGNDGLNTIVPHRQDAYHRLRPTLALKSASLHALDEEHGLHPSLGELGALHAEGLMTVLHGVGYPEPDRSHFRSMEIWHGADPVGPARGVGWLGRMADQILAAEPGSMPALHVGDEDLPLALRGRDVCASTVRDEDSLRLAELPGLAAERERVSDERGGSGELAFLRAAARGAYAASERLAAAVSRPGRAAYPDLGLARKLRLVAKLVAGGFDTRVYLVSLGGFDTHARQAPLHAARLEELARSLGAFQRDLADAGARDRVLTLVFSEFGRRAAENGSRGTDHGAAAPVLLIGGPGRGGLRGTPPALERLEDGDVGYTTDFRALYTAIESEWMGLVPSTSVPSCDPFS